MAREKKRGGIAGIFGELQRSSARRKQVRSAEPDPQLKLLRAWQVQRLTNTYQDLLDSPRYEAAGRYFLSDIYSPRDFSQRDHDLIQLYELVSKFLPERMLVLLIKVIELNQLTSELDDRLLEVLVGELGMKDELTAEMYAEAYRRCDNYIDRARQIDLIVELGEGVDKMVASRLTGGILVAFRGPARAAGWEEVHDFLSRGYAAFKKMGGAEAFLGIIRKRETEILDRIFSAEPEPFQIEN